MNTPQPPTSKPPGTPSPQSRRGSSSATCPPFHPATLQFQMNLDTALRWGAVVAVVGTLLISSAVGMGTQIAYLLALLAAGGWIAVSLSSARVWQVIPQITALLEQDPAGAEHQIALSLRRRALHRPVRLLLYHRLAVLRHRQQRFAEAAVICQSLLSYKLGSVRQIKPHLLLLLVECRLLTGDLYGAWEGLTQLSQMPLSLLESTQAMALRTRYAIASGYFQDAIDQVAHKVQLAELMPPPQCGAWHAMLAFAAERCGQTALAHWLTQRAELISTPRQLEALASSGVLIMPPAGNLE